MSSRYRLLPLVGELNKSPKSSALLGVRTACHRNQLSGSIVWVLIVISKDINDLKPDTFEQELQFVAKSVARVQRDKSLPHQRSRGVEFLEPEFELSYLIDDIVLDQTILTNHRMPIWEVEFPPHRKCLSWFLRQSLQIRCDDIDDEISPRP